MSINLEHRTIMQPIEKKTTYAVAGIFSTRMLGLFMIFPVFSLFANDEFKDITGFQIGLAMGIYGLTQALLQIPFGMLSDKYGRKPMILIGMLVFMFGSIICAMSESIEMMIIGRAIQGMGAVAAVLMATIADNVTEQYRLRAMSVVGITIGLSFTLSLVLGPLLSSFFGVRGIFWVIAMLAIVGMALVVFAIPSIKHQEFQREAEADPAQFKDVLKNKELLRLDFGVFVLHAILTAMFVAIPILIHQISGLTVLEHWHLYLPVMILSFVLMIPFIIQAESNFRMKNIFVGAIVVVVLAQFGFMTLTNLDNAYWSIFVWLLIFFTAFNLLEASLPSLVVKISPADQKGTASGVYSSSQFFGAAIGGSLGGYFYGQYGFEGVFFFTGILGLAWVAVAVFMKNPKPLSIASLHYDFVIDDSNKNKVETYFMTKTGVYEIKIHPEENRIYFKINRKEINEDILLNVLQDYK